MVQFARFLPTRRKNYLSAVTLLCISFIVGGCIQEPEGEIAENPGSATPHSDPRLEIQGRILELPGSARALAFNVWVENPNDFPVSVCIPDNVSIKMLHDGTWHDVDADIQEIEQDVGFDDMSFPSPEEVQAMGIPKTTLMLAPSTEPISPNIAIFALIEIPRDVVAEHNSVVTSTTVE